MLLDREMGEKALMGKAWTSAWALVTNEVSAWIQLKSQFPASAAARLPRVVVLCQAKQ